jgi:hypothetical protein
MSNRNSYVDVLTAIADNSEQTAKRFGDSMPNGAAELKHDAAVLRRLALLIGRAVDHTECDNCDNVSEIIAELRTGFAP